LATNAERLHMRDLMKFLLTVEPQVRYPRGDIRGAKDAETFALTEPQMRNKLKAGGELMFDCSQSTGQILIWAGVKAAWLRATYSNGVPVVYTGTMLGHLPHYTDPSKAGIGALVVYGPATGDHVSMVYEPGADPLLWSHGFDGGPQLVRLSVQRSYHRAPVTFCSIAKL
jgi:hypothetical protein